MVTTVMIHGSKGEVLVPFGSWGTFIPGRRRMVRVIKAGTDANTPAIVQEAMVGMEIPVVLSGKEVNKHFREDAQVDSGVMLAYAAEIVEVLQQAGKNEAARELRRITPGNLDMWIFEAGTFEVLSS